MANEIALVTNNRMLAVRMYQSFLFSFGTYVYRIPSSKYEEIETRILSKYNIDNIQNAHLLAMEDILSAFKDVADVAADP